MSEEEKIEELIEELNYITDSLTTLIDELPFRSRCGTIGMSGVQRTLRNISTSLYDISDKFTN